MTGRVPEAAREPQRAQPDEELTALGFDVAGVARRDHPHPGVEMRVCWVDA